MNLRHQETSIKVLELGAYKTRNTNATISFTIYCLFAKKKPGITIANLLRNATFDRYIIHFRLKRPENLTVTKIHCKKFH